jgi:predicted restriction endonuclease
VDRFLEQLVKYREPKKPLNGVLVAIAVNELLDANEDSSQHGKKLRARIDEMHDDAQDGRCRSTCSSPRPISSPVSSSSSAT